jgi:hypothetical protein
MTTQQPDQAFLSPYLLDRSIYQVACPELEFPILARRNIKLKRDVIGRSEKVYTTTDQKMTCLQLSDSCNV